MKHFLCCLTLLLIHCGGAPHIDRQPFPAAEPASSPSPTEWFKIIVLDVGQGDATLLIAPEGDGALAAALAPVLIDTGPPQTGSQAVLEVMKEQGFNSIRTIFISHHHEDHIGGLEALLKTEWGAQAAVIDKSNAKVGETLFFGKVLVHILAANGQIGNTFISDQARQDENNLNHALLIEYGTFRYFTDGDLPGGGGDPPYQTPDLESLVAPLVGDVNVILVPHHGSHTSTNENFLATLKPEVGILSVGIHNDYFHPHPSVLQRLEKSGLRLLRTDKEGSICIATDGEKYVVKPYAVDKCADPF